MSAYRVSAPTTRPSPVPNRSSDTWWARPIRVPTWWLPTTGAVAGASDRVVVNRHGATYEDRHLVHAVVTSSANHGRLEEIRLANHRLSDAPGEVTASMIEEMPVVVHMGYGVHGNEASSSEAAMLVLYHLAAGSGPAVEDLLDRAVIILDPNYNPDGRDRFVNWANGNRGRVATRDGQDREHVEPWPGGRTNHYWFDLNRDWLVAQHPESQARLGLFHHWRAQVLTDFHEMGSNATYFFQPGIPSRNNPNTPDRAFELTAALAAHHAEWHDRQGTFYYSEETFDDYFYGKGSTYPDVNGAIGILFEQASAPVAGTRNERRDPDASLHDPQPVHQLHVHAGRQPGPARGTAVPPARFLPHGSGSGQGQPGQGLRPRPGRVADADAGPRADAAPSPHPRLRASERGRSGRAHLHTGRGGHSPHGPTPDAADQGLSRKGHFFRGFALLRHLSLDPAPGHGGRKRRTAPERRWPRRSGNHGSRI